MCLALASCGGDDSVLAEVETLKDRVCACKDPGCVAELKKKSQGLEKKLSKLSGEEMDKALKISVTMMECASNLGVPQNGL